MVASGRMRSAPMKLGFSQTTGLIMRQGQIEGLLGDHVRDCRGDLCVRPLPLRRKRADTMVRPYNVQ